MVGCEHMVLMVVLMTIKDRFTSFGRETLTVPTTSQNGQRLDSLHNKAHCGAPDWEVAEISPRGSLGSPCLVYKGVTMIQERCTVLSCVVQRVLSRFSPFAMPWWYFGAWQHVWNRVLWVQWYTSGQSKTIRIAVPAVMGELSNVFSWLVSHLSQ